jgi:hypothetical protein
MTAKPASGYYFAGWQSQNTEFLSDSPTITVTMDHTPYILFADFFYGTTTRPVGSDYLKN